MIFSSQFRAVFDAFSVGFLLSFRLVFESHFGRHIHAVDALSPEGIQKRHGLQKSKRCMGCKSPNETWAAEVHKIHGAAEVHKIHGLQKSKRCMGCRNPNDTWAAEVQMRHGLQKSTRYMGLQKSTRYMGCRSSTKIHGMQKSTRYMGCKSPGDIQSRKDCARLKKSCRV